jgi:Lon protease-like protein
MAEILPLFPLGAVLYPGMVLPLHIFEERYRCLVGDLLAGPEPRKFGVLGIRHGRETAILDEQSRPPELYEVGCTAVVREVLRSSSLAHDDGRFDVLAVGGERFRLLSTDRSRPYLAGSVEPLPDAIGEPAALPAVAPVRAAFGKYLSILDETGGPTVTVDELPSEPVLLSYVVAAAMIIDLPERQGLLEESCAATRLVAERDLLRRELGVLRATSSRPAPDLRYTRHSPN